MSPCDRIDELLSAYLDGELTQQKRQGVAVHVESCPYCRRALDDISRIREAIGRLDSPEPSQEQWSQMMRITVTKTSRGLGWLISLAAALLLIGYAAYEFATDETTDALVKIATAGVVGGVLLLLLSVLLDRLHARKTDKYKDVEL